LIFQRQCLKTLKREKKISRYINSLRAKKSKLDSSLIKERESDQKITRDNYENKEARNNKMNEKKDRTRIKSKKIR